MVNRVQIINPMARPNCTPDRIVLNLETLVVSFTLAFSEFTGEFDLNVSDGIKAEMKAIKLPETKSMTMEAGVKIPVSVPDIPVRFFSVGKLK